MLFHLFFAGGLVFAFELWFYGLFDSDDDDVPNSAIGFKDPNFLFGIILFSAPALLMRMDSWRSRVVPGLVWMLMLTGFMVLAREAFCFCRLKWWQYLVIGIWLAALDWFFDSRF